MGFSLSEWQAFCRDRPDLVMLHPDAPSRPSQFKGGAKGCYRITIPGFHPTPLNKLLNAHWATASRRKKLDRTIIGLAAGAQHVPPATGMRRVHLAITLKKGQRAPDTDAFWKSLLDALVQAKLLRDDSRTWCVLDPVEYVRGTEKETSIELTDL